MTRKILRWAGLFGIGLLVHHVTHAPYPPELVVLDDIALQGIFPFAAGFALLRLWVPFLFLSQFTMAARWYIHLGAMTIEPIWNDDFSRYGN
jgi:hypothetical protein